MTYLKKPNILRLKIKETDNTCKKVYFATQQFADDYIKKLQKTSNRKIVPVGSYLCPICKCWHLTSGTAVDLQKEFDKINTELRNENKRLKTENKNLKYKLMKLLKS